MNNLNLVLISGLSHIKEIKIFLLDEKCSNPARSDWIHYSFIFIFIVYHFYNFHTTK